jgi:hypothetical protein
MAVAENAGSVNFCLKCQPDGSLFFRLGLWKQKKDNRLHHWLSLQSFPSYICLEFGWETLPISYFPILPATIQSVNVGNLLKLKMQARESCILA